MQHMPLNIREGMNVCDRNNDKIGTVKMVHQLGRATGVGGTTIGEGYGEGYVHVDTGLFGLGKDLYIPFNQFSSCSSDCCFLSVDKNEIDRMGWDRRPTNI